MGRNPYDPLTTTSSYSELTAGFEPGQRVRITVEYQKLIITPL